MLHRPRNQRTCRCVQCGVSFLSYKSDHYCGSNCRHQYNAVHGTTKLNGATDDGASTTGYNT